MSVPPATGCNPHVNAIDPPPIPTAQAWLDAYNGAHGPAIDLSQAVPGYPPHPDMLARLRDAAGSVDFAGYGPIEGEDALRQSLADHVAELYGAPLCGSSIHITAGCNQAFFSASMAIAGPGDRILMSNPCYFNHEATLAMQGIETAYFTCRAENGFQPRLKDIEDAITDRIKAIALVSPNNPTGAVYDADLLQAIFNLCRSRGLRLILDETYRDFLPAEAAAPHRLFDNPDWGRTLVQLYSFSKAYCIPGHRVGAVTTGPDLVAQIAKVMDNLQICAPRAAQAALAGAISPLADWRKDNAAEIARRAEAFRTALAGAKDWPIRALGAYFAYVEHPFADRTSANVAQNLAQNHGLLCLPGAFFGPDQNRYLRFAFANVDVPTIGLITDRLNSATR